MLIKIYPENPNPKEIARTVEILRSGGLIIYPTDTVYAVGCDIFNAKAVENICRLKKLDVRRANLSFICYDLSHISEYAKVSNATFKLMKKNLPGAFTFILEGNNHLPKLFKQKKTVGIRVPDNAIIRTIVQELGNPVLSASLRDENDPIQQYYTDPELMHEQFEHIVNAVIDGGYGQLVPSTVVSCLADDFTIVRQGKGELLF